MTMPSRSGQREIRIGMLRLTDAAPLVVATEKGLFHDRELDVRIVVEPSWANIADKLSFGHLDAAVMLPSLALAMALGLRGTPVPVTVVMGISLNGNSVTVSHKIPDAIGHDGSADAMDTGRRLRAWLREQRARPRLAVVHVFSTHNFLLRYWLAAAGIDPDADVEICTLPPSDTAQALRAGEIDGFCAGAPWGSVATASGAGRSIVVSSEIWRDHPEKCLAVGAFASQEPRKLQHLIDALSEGARYCDDPRNALEVATLLSRPEYLNLDATLIRASLPAFAVDTLSKRGAVDRSLFAARGASIPQRAHAAWFLSQMARWRYLTPPIDSAALVDAVYRPEFVQTLVSDADAPRAERFCDGATFDATQALAALRGT
jgi:two-component system, oxyanion-binding sensor